MKVSFHPEAVAELMWAVEHYEQCQKRLGIEFAEEVHSAVARIIQYPKAWAAFSDNTRRCLVSRFPYSMIYQVKDRTVRIIAVAHLHRRPDYWKMRLDLDKPQQ